MALIPMEYDQGFSSKTTLSNFNTNGQTWVAPSDGILIFGTTASLPSGITNGYVYILEGSNYIGAVSCPSGTGGLAQISCCPIRKGQTYTIYVGGWTTAGTWFFSFR